MKRFLTVLWMFALVCGLAWARSDKEAVVEEPETVKLVAAHGYPTYYQAVLDQFASDYPNVEITWVWGEAADGLFAAGTPPNIYMGTPGRVGGYLIPGYAVELTDANVENLDDYYPGTLDIYHRDGKLYAMPVMIHPKAMSVNLTLAEKVGFVVPTDRNYLSIEETVEFFELIKQRAPGYYGTALTWIGDRNWFASFGATWFENADYSKTTINSPQALKALQFMKFIQQQGYIEPFAEAIDEDFTLAEWAQGRYGMHWSNAGGRLGMIDIAVEEGLIDKAFDHRFFSYPRATGVTNVSWECGGAAGCAIKSGNDFTDKMAVALLDYMTGGLAQKMTMDGGNFPTRKSAGTEVLPQVKEWWKIHTDEMSEIIRTNTMYDLGNSTTYYMAIWQEWNPLWQDFLADKISAEDLLDELEVRVNKLLAE